MLTEMLKYAKTGSVSKRFALVSVLQKINEFSSESRRVFGWKNATGGVVIDKLWQSARTGDNDWKSARHGFSGAKAKGVDTRRLDVDIQKRQVFVYGGIVAGKRNGMFHIKLPRKGGKCRALGPFAPDNEARIGKLREDVGYGTKQDVVALDTAEISARAD